MSVALLVVALLAVPASARAQSDELQIDDVDDAEYPIVEVAVTVPEALADVPLSKESFSITEDGQQFQPYLGASDTDTDTSTQPPAPHVVLAIDVSGSMVGSIDEAREAADTFVAQLPSESQVAVVTFGDRSNVLMKPTAQLQAVRGKLATVDYQPDARTALFDGVREAAGLLDPGVGETATVVVLSDGKDTVGGASKEDAIAALKDHDATLWAVELPSSEQDHAALTDLAGDPTRVLTAADADDLNSIYSGIASSLARQYVLRYESDADGPTELMVSLDHGSVSAQRHVDATIEPSSTGQVEETAVQTVDPDSFVVTVPLLGTFGAYLTGLTAVATGAFILLLMVLAPRAIRPRERLIVGHQTADHPTAGLTSFAQWTTDAADRRLRRGNLGAQLDTALENAGLNVRPGEVVVMVASAMIVLYALGVIAGSAIVGVAVALLAPLLFRLWLGMRRDKRQAAFADQLTDVLQLVGSSLRAGYGLTQGIDAVSRDTEEPSAGEFRRIVVEHRLGRDLNEAMKNCAERMDNTDFSWVVQAISIHRDVGGDLAKVLDNIIATIRDRADVHRQVRSLSAEGRLSARMLIALPVLVLLVLMMMNPGYLQPMMTDPLGWLLFAIAGLLMTVGMLIIRRIAKIRY